MKKNLLLILVMVLCGMSRAQSLDSTLARYASEFSREKVWLHLDKSSYSPGETVWFKAYVLEDIFPAMKTKTLYVDWIAPDGSVLHHSVSPIIEGTTNGQFEVPEEYEGNFVHVRAYTKWMLNFDTAFLYEKEIKILQRSNKAAVKAEPIPTLQLFPEGGDLIAGVSNRVAFKANDQWGRPVKIKAALQSDANQFMDSLRFEHDGMGSFYLLPENGKVYSVRWKDAKGKEYTTPLPAVKPTGVILQMALNGTRRIVSLTRTENAASELKQLHLVGTMNGNKIFQTDIELASSTSAQRVIPTENLPSGILTLTLFDANWNAIAERITFVDNQEYTFKPSMEVLHWGLGKRKKNEIEIKVPEHLAGANLSISVTDVAIEKDTSDNIISHLMLSSDIRGRVHNPAYYFSSGNPNASQHLDLVMMTHGWRRFNWEEITKGALPKINFPRDTAHLSLSGQVVGVGKSQFTGNEAIVLLVKQDSAMTTFFLPVDRSGNFSDPGVIFFDTLSVYYSLKSKSLVVPEVKFMTNRLPAPNYKTLSKNFLSTYPLADTSGTSYHSYLASEALRLEQVRRGKVLEMVTVSTTKKSPVETLEDRYPRSPLFKGGDGYQFDLVNDPGAGAFMNILNYLQGRVAGLQVTPGANPTMTWRGGTPVIYLDEFPTDLSMLNSVPISDVAYIKVFRPPFIGASNGGSGAIAIYTKRGEDVRNTKGGLSSNKIFGYTPVREFYSPNYNRFDPRHEEPDVRTTLYWNPQLETSPTKNTIRLTFYNNDVTKAFRVVIEGMTKDGLLTHFEEIME